VHVNLSRNPVVQCAEEADQTDGEESGQASIVDSVKQQDFGCKNDIGCYKKHTP